MGLVKHQSSRPNRYWVGKSSSVKATVQITYSSIMHSRAAPLRRDTYEYLFLQLHGPTMDLTLQIPEKAFFPSLGLIVVSWLSAVPKSIL